MTAFAELNIEARTDALERAVAEIRKIGAEGDKTEAKVAKATGGMDVGFRKLAGAAGLFLGSLVSMQTATASFVAAKGFDAALVETSTLLAGNAAQMKIVEAGARSMAREFGGSATSQVQAYYQAISAGAGDASAATKLLDDANRLAKGGVTDVTTAVDVLTTATNAYKSSGLTAASASDALFVGMKAGKTTITELSAAVGGVLPIATSLGVSFDETVAAMAALTTQGISTSQAATGVRAALTSMIAPTAEAQKVANALGIEFSAAGVSAMGFGGVMDQIVEKTGGNTEAIQKLFGSIEATTAALSFAGGAGVKYQEIMGNMATKAGATSEAFNLVALSLSDRLNVATATASDVLMGFGQNLLTVIVPAAEAAAGVLVLLADNADTLTGLVISSSAAIAFYMAPAMYAAATATGAFVLSLITLKGALIATGIGAIIVASGYLIGKFIELSRATGGFGNALVLLGEVAVGVWDGIKTSASSINPALASVWSTIQAGFLGMLSVMAKRWADFLHTITQGMASVPGMGDAALALSGIAIKAGSAVYEIGAAADAANQKAQSLAATAKGLVTGGFDAAVESAGRLKEAVESIPDASAIVDPSTAAQQGVISPTGSGGAIMSGGGGGGGGGSASDGFASKLDALTQQFQTERELADQWHEENMQILSDRRAMEILGAQEHAEMKLAVESEYQARLIEIKAQGHGAEQQMMRDTMDAGIGLLQQFGAKSKGLAIAGLVLNAARRVMEIRANTAAAIMRAYAELGPVAGAAAATKIKAMGMVQTAIAATSAVLSGAGGGGGGGGSIGSGGSSGSREATLAPAQQEKIVRLDVRGEGMFAEMLRESGAAIVDALTNESKYGGTTVVMGR